MPPSGQWISSTDGRIAPHGDAWLEAVIWFQEYSKYEARNRTHGPTRVGQTTLRVARALAHLKECRPGVARLMKWLTLSERTVQYHLRILRETGLLTYRSQGTRIAGVGGRATEFLRTIPPVYDEAARLRTGPSEALIRSVRGIAPEGIPLLKKLHRKARRPMIKKRTKATNHRNVQSTSGHPTCTPMVVGTSSLSSTGDLSIPPESKLRGATQTATSKTPRPRTLNRTGRRFQLAGELIQHVGWLHRASVARIAWIVRHVSDAGWTADEVIALISQLEPAQRVNRPSGFLAYRLGSAHLLYDTRAKRAVLLDAWRASAQATAQRHMEWSGAWQAPSSRAVSRQVREAFVGLRQRDGIEQSLEPFPLGEDGQADLTQLTRDEIVDLRSAALRDPDLVETAIDICGEPYARRLYTHRLVDQVMRLRSTGRLVLHGSWSAR